MIIDKTDDCIKIKDDNIASKNYNRTYTFDFGFIKCKDNKTVVKKNTIPKIHKLIIGLKINDKSDPLCTKFTIPSITQDWGVTNEIFNK